MTDKKQAAPKTRSKQAGGKFGPNYTAEQKELAFKIWKETGFPTLEELAKTLRADHGMALVKSTLSRWIARDVEWQKLWLEYHNPLSPLEILEALSQAKDEANLIDVDHLLGVKTALIARLYMSIRGMTFTTVPDMDGALACCDKIEALIHAERGKAVSEKQSGKHVSLVASLGQPVTVAPFKKTNGGGNGANGGGY
jgi:hypothetical protein